MVHFLGHSVPVLHSSVWIANVECYIVSIAKEIRLRHGAPVIMVEVIDRLGRPLPAPLEVQHERARAPDMSGGHQVIVCSREQLKVCEPAAAAAVVVDISVCVALYVAKTPTVILWFTTV